MSKIVVEITEQRFELIRNRIAQILTDELNGQFVITSNPLFTAKVWLERFIPFDKTELPAINVTFFNSNYDNQTPIASIGTNVYNIQVVTFAKDTDTERGDVLAIKKCEKLCGVIRYILENPNYLELEFNNPRFVSNVKIRGINISDPASNQDGFHSVSGQVICEVTAEELNGELTALEAERYTTMMKMDETEKGIFLELFN